MVVHELKTRRTYYKKKAHICKVESPVGAPASPPRQPPRASSVHRRLMSVGAHRKLGERSDDREWLDHAARVKKRTNGSRMERDGGGRTDHRLCEARITIVYVSRPERPQASKQPLVGMRR